MSVTMLFDEEADDSPIEIKKVLHEGQALIRLAQDSDTIYFPVKYLANFIDAMKDVSLGDTETFS
jgi:hypothetical protein